MFVIIIHKRQFDVTSAYAYLPTDSEEAKSVAKELSRDLQDTKTTVRRLADGYVVAEFVDGEPARAPQWAEVGAMYSSRPVR